MRAAAAPVSFDLRSVGGVSPVKDQSPYGTCWAFATIASLESTRLMSGRVTPFDSDLSELHLAWFAFNDDVAPAFDAGIPSNTLQNGGNFDMSTAILTRGTGPTDEESMPYYDAVLTSDWKDYLLSSDAYPRRLWVKDVWRLAIGDDPGTNLANRAETYAVMKEWIQTKGAVAISYLAGDYYTYHPDFDWANHAVAVVGWDDTVPAANFNPAPPGDGAWIIKNSWGTWWGSDGYGYISYYDRTLTDGVALFIGGDPDEYDKVYFYDPLGAYSGYLWWPEINPGDLKSMWAANIFTADQDSEVKAVAFDTRGANTGYDIRVYVNVDASNPSSGDLAARVTGTLLYAGHYTIDLTEAVPVLEGQDFSVVIRQTVSSGALSYPGDFKQWEPYKSFMAVDTTPEGDPTGWKTMMEVLGGYDADHLHLSPCIRALVTFGIPLRFRDSAAYDIPESAVGVPIGDIDVSGGVIGGVLPYTFSASGLPSGVAIDATTGVISGSPKGVRSAGTATITVTDGAGDSDSITIAFGSVNPAPVYTASITPSSGSFGTTAVGYSTLPEMEFTVTNTGNQPLTGLSVLLSGAQSGSFTVTSPASTFGISKNGTQKIKARPKAGLTAGTYTAKLSVTGGGMATSPSASLSFTVQEPVVPVVPVVPAVPTRSVSLAPTDFTFAALTEGYSNAGWKAFVLKNTGSEDLTVSIGLDSSAFEVATQAALSIASGKESYVTVRPRAGLSAGTYTATLTVSGGELSADVSAAMSFTVNAAPSAEQPEDKNNNNGDDNNGDNDNGSDGTAPSGAEEGATGCGVGAGAIALALPACEGVRKRKRR
jgi:C1A family cysteine protease